MTAIRRQVLPTRHGQLHVRLAGPGAPGGGGAGGGAGTGAADGPLPLVLLHFTPYSSVQFEPFMRLLGSDRTVVAVDRLGFGFSDPHPQPGLPMAEIAQATLDAVDALGIGRFDLIGIHTGAIEALELATTLPGRVRRLGLVAIPVWTPEEKDAWREKHSRIARRVAEDGSHLLKQWNGVKAVSEGRYPNSALSDPPAPWPVEHVDAFVQQLLLGRHAIAPTLHAVFDYPVDERLPRVTQPLLAVRTFDDIWEQTGRAVPLLPPQARHVELAHLDILAFVFGAEELAALFRPFLDEEVA